MQHLHRFNLSARGPNPLPPRHSLNPLAAGFAARRVLLHSGVCPRICASPSSRNRRAGPLQVCFQATTVSSAMFITAMAANPLAVNLAADALGSTISWGTWALAGIVPGLFVLLTMPLLLYIVYPPQIKDTPNAPIEAKYGSAPTPPPLLAHAINLLSGAKRSQALDTLTRCCQCSPDCAMS